MSQIISTYPIFEGSQVLTSTQLNQLAAYLDQQGRLTRSKLIGMGIVCGMQVQPYPQGLQITKGLGITSEGFLIQGGNFNATHYRPYSLPESVEYKPFKDGNHAVSLFELLTEVPSDNTGVKKLTNPANFLNDKYVLIFIEIFDKDLKSCLGNACDDRGQDRLFTLRRLVISESDLDLILKNKSHNVKSPFPNVLDLPEFSVQKPLFYPGKPESNEFGAFVKYYQKFIGITLSKEFFEALTLSYKIFEPILSKSYSFSNPIESGAIQDKIAEIKTLTEANPSDIQGIQYLWGFAKEIIKAYSEFRNSAMELWYNCVTDSSLFPLHLMLGRARTTSETQAQFLKYRHGFVQPPIFNQQKLLAETCIQRHRRMIMLIEKLETGIFLKGESEKFPIKITPSGEKLGKLGDRAIPYYYEIKSKSSVSKWFSLEDNWVDPGNFQLHSTYRAGVQSYDNQPDEEETEAKSPLETPLFYDIESYPFLRIEGHLNKGLDAAVNQIKKLILQFNLPIHVEVLHLGESEENEYLEDCGWNDLQEEYAYQRRIVSGFVQDLKDLFDYVTEYAKEEEGEDDFTKDEFYIKASETLEMLLTMAKALPECLKDLNWMAFQNAYKQLLQLLIDFVLIEQKLLQEIKVKDGNEKELEYFNGILARISPFLYQVLDLLFFAKLQRIYISYQSRIKVLIQSNQFANYLKKHNGLTHEAGVYKTGTFFLLHDPKQKRIIGDFSLPYYCCECTPCIEPCGENSIVLPPFARPDYAIAFTEKTTRIDITLNDFLTNGRDYEVIQVGESSLQKGKVEKDQESNSFRYTSATGFTGIDSFQYILRDKESRESDQGKVTIWVRGEQACYAIDILTCWGIEFVHQTLVSRQIEFNKESDTEALEKLLQSLTKTNGFTLEELRSGAFEKVESLLKLLGCLNLPNTDLTREQAEQAILDHQAKNCGGIITPDCTSMGVRGTVRGQDGSSIYKARVSVKDTEIDTYTSDNGTYEIQFPSPNQTLLFELEGFENQEVKVCSQEVVNITMVPSPTSVRECYSIAIISRWDNEFIQFISSLRDISYTPTNLQDTFAKLLDSLRSTAGFTSTELRESFANYPEFLKMILASVGTDPSNINPKEYASYIEEYQGYHCGASRREAVIIDATRIPEEELKKYLDAKNVTYLSGADKNVLVETFKASTTDSSISRKDLEIFKKDTLLKISEEKSIEVNTSDTKAKLIDRLLGK